MRSVAIGGSILLLLLILAAYVGFRRSPAAGPSPASLDPLDSDDPDAGPDGGAPAPLSFAPAEVDLGTLVPGESRRVTVAWRRGGAGSLRVTAVETGCGCLVALGLPEVVSEGATGAIEVEVRGRSHPGPFGMTVRVVTDRVGAEVVRLPVRGFVGASTWVEPRVLDLGALSPGHEARRTIAVRVPPARASPGSPARGPPRGALRVETRLVGIEGSAVAGAPSAGVSSAAGADVVLTVRAPSVPGPFRGSLELLVGGADVERVAVRGEVVRPPP